MMDDPLSHCFSRLQFLAAEDQYRLQLAQRYSYVVPEPQLLEVIRHHSPLLELGAGTGYWAYLLRAMGADVIAYDHAPVGAVTANRYHVNFRLWTEVRHGDVDVVANHVDRALFLCWPPRFSSLWRAIDLFSGEVILHIGDGGTRTLRLDIPHPRFKLAAVYPATALDPAPATTPQLCVWRRA